MFVHLSHPLNSPCTLCHPLNYVSTFLASIELCLYIFGIHWIMFIHLWHPLNSPCTLWHPLNYVCTFLAYIELCLYTLTSVELWLYIFDIHWIMFVHILHPLNYVCTLWHLLNSVCSSLSSIDLCLYIFGIHWIMFIHLWHPLNSLCKLWHPLNYVSTSLSSIELCLYIFDIHWIIFVYTFVFWYPMNFVSASLDPVQYGILLVQYDIYYSMVSNTDFLKSKCWPVCLMVFGISLVCTCYLRYTRYRYWINSLEKLIELENCSINNFKANENKRILGDRLRITSRWDWYSFRRF